MKNDFDAELTKLTTQRDSIQEERDKFDVELKEIKKLLKEQVCKRMTPFLGGRNVCVG